MRSGAPPPPPGQPELLTCAPSILKFSSSSLPRGAKAMSPWFHKNWLTCRRKGGRVRRHSPSPQHCPPGGPAHLLSNIQHGSGMSPELVASPEKQIFGSQAGVPGI